MKLLAFRSTWGLVDDSDGQKALSPHKTLDTALPALSELGYDGIEIPLKGIFQYGKEKFKKVLKDCNLKVIVMVFTDGKYLELFFKRYNILQIILKGPVAPGGSEVVFGGPYPGFTTPINPGATDKQKIMQTHIQVFKVQSKAHSIHI